MSDRDSTASLNYMNTYTVVRNIFITIMLVTVIVGFDIAHTSKPSVVMAQEIVTVASPSPLPTAYNVKVTIITSTPKPKVLTVQEKIKEAFGEDSEMNHVAFCESSFNPRASHKNSSAKGLFQIINGTWNHYKCTGDPLNADDNIKCAKKIYEKRGLLDWKASEGCWGI